MDGNRVEAIIKVLAKLAVVDGLFQVDVGGSHDAHVGLAHLARAHADIFARFEHTQQPCLRGERQFAHFVEEERASVGGGKVALALLHGSRERTLLVSEKFRVDGAFGNGAAVHGKVALVLAQAVVVNDAREHLFARAVLARNQHGEVHGGNLHGDFQGAVECLAVAYDAVFLLNILKVEACHIFIVCG